jgi:type III pantothenate kinase
MLLAVDIGNTKTKAAVFKDAALVNKYIINSYEAPFEVRKIFSDYPEISQSILSSVGNEQQELLSVLQNRTNLTVISHTSAFPFINKYATPATLGVDRMVLASGAVLAHPLKNRLVIDAGTCVTYDFIDADDNYLGGAISPGLRLRYEALHNFTAKLPLLSAEAPRQYIGNSTQQSIHSGVVNGLLHEVQGFINQYREQYPGLTIILTGGDAEFLAKQFKNTIFANSNFLLESLNHLYLYSIKK